MARDVFKQMRYAFDHKLDLSSEWAILHRVAILSRVEPVWYHCCVKKKKGEQGVVWMKKSKKVNRGFRFKQGQTEHKFECPGTQLNTRKAGEVI